MGAGRCRADLGCPDQALFVLGQQLLLVGEELPQARDRSVYDPPEHVVKGPQGIDPAAFAGLDQPHEKRGCPACKLGNSATVRRLIISTVSEGRFLRLPS